LSAGHRAADEERIDDMIGPGNVILWIVVGAFVAIALTLLGLACLVVLRRGALPRPARRKAERRTHHDLVMAIAPILVFALVSVPLLRLLYLRNTVPPADLTVTVTGRMWFWTFDYSSPDNFRFRAPMLLHPIAETAENALRPGAYNHLVVPVARTVRIVAVGNDVIYSWAIPTLGATIEALPGRANQSWFTATKEGRYYGQCSELCGLPHAFKPFEIEVVSQSRFEKWAAEAKRNLALAGLATPGDSVRTP
jgi:cytochrome c oxidase subunit II